MTTEQGRGWRTPEKRHNADSQDAQGRRHERKVDELGRDEDHPRDAYEHRRHAKERAGRTHQLRKTVGT